MVNFCLIDFQMGLPLYNYIQFSKDMAKMANFQPKIGRDATFASTLNRCIILRHHTKYYQNDHRSARRDKA